MGTLECMDVVVVATEHVRRSGSSSRSSGSRRSFSSAPGEPFVGLQPRALHIRRAAVFEWVRSSSVSARSSVRIAGRLAVLGRGLVRRRLNLAQEERDSDRAQRRHDRADEGDDLKPVRERCAGHLENLVRERVGEIGAGRDGSAEGVRRRVCLLGRNRRGDVVLDPVR